MLPTSMARTETPSEMQENLSMHLTIDEFRRLGYRAVDIAAEHLAQVPSGPVYRQMKAEDRARLVLYTQFDQARSA
jgi:hypothetical protein